MGMDPPSPGSPGGGRRTPPRSPSGPPDRRPWKPPGAPSPGPPRGGGQAPSPRRRRRLEDAPPRREGRDGRDGRDAQPARAGRPGPAGPAGAAGAPGGAGGGGGGSGGGSAASAAAAAGGAVGAGAAGAQRALEAAKKLKKKRRASGITKAKKRYTDLRKIKLAGLRALKQKRIREFATKTKKLPKGKRAQARKEFKEKADARYRAIVAKFPPARGLRDLRTVLELIKKLESVRMAQ